MTNTIPTNEGNLLVLSSKTFTIGPNENSTFTHDVERTRIRVRRPRGKKEGIVIRYENGAFSSVTWL